MTIDEFIRRAGAQPIVAVEVEVSVAGPGLRAFMDDGQCHTLAELNAHPDQHKEMRTFRHRHILGPGLSDAEIDAWQVANPAYPLSGEIRELLRRVDGIHLWANVETSRAYFGVLPLREWKTAEGTHWAEYLEIWQMSSANKLGISYHDNGDYDLLYDTSDRTFSWYDPWEVTQPRVSRSVAEFLEFWWNETAWLDPRRNYPEKQT